MIKLRFLFLFIFLVFFCKAQKDEDIDKKINFVNYTEIGLVQNSNFINNSLRYSFQTINGVEINEKSSFGIGLGYDTYYFDNLIPVFVDIRRFLFKHKKSGFFISLSSGNFFSFNKSTITSNSLFLYPQIGLQFYITQNVSLNLNFGYQYRYALARSLDVWDSVSMQMISQEMPNFNLHFYPFKIGFKF